MNNKYDQYDDERQNVKKSIYCLRNNLEIYLIWKKERPTITDKSRN